MNAAQLINQTSGDFEWYTPPDIIAAARECMGGIDLDPFSSEAANANIKALHYFTERDNGFVKPWFGRVWCNHPFGRIQNPAAVATMLTEFGSGRVTDILAITYACTSEKWFRPLLARPQCYLYPRTNYFLPDGSLKRGVTKGSVVTYFGANPANFYKAFRNLGAVMVPYCGVIQ